MVIFIVEHEKTSIRSIFSFLFSLTYVGTDDHVVRGGEGCRTFKPTVKSLPFEPAVLKN